MQIRWADAFAVLRIGEFMRNLARFVTIRPPTTSTYEPVACSHSLSFSACAFLSDEISFLEETNAF